MKKSKLFAPFLMLLAGAAACIMMSYFKYSTEQLLLILLLVLIVFYIIGYFIQKKITSFVEQILAQEAREGEVIEKEAPENTEEQEAEESKILQAGQTVQSAE